LAGDQHAACGRRPVALDEICRELVTRVGADRNSHRRAFEQPDERSIARVAWIGEQDPLVAVHDERHHQQQRRRRSGRDDDAFGCDIDAIMVDVMSCDCLAQRRQSKRRRVIDVTGRDRPLRRIDHWLRSREIGLTDLHVDDVAPRCLERARRRLHLHHVKRLDVANATGDERPYIHRRS